MNKAILMSALFAVSLVSLPPAFASDEIVSTRNVRYGDLDLGTEGGKKTLEQRIRRAAKAVCGGETGRSDWQTFSANQKCRQIAIANSRPQVMLAMAKSARRVAMNDRPGVTLAGVR